MFPPDPVPFSLPHTIPGSERNLSIPYLTAETVAGMILVLSTASVIRQIPAVNTEMPCKTCCTKRIEKRTYIKKGLRPGLFPFAEKRERGNFKLPGKQGLWQQAKIMRRSGLPCLPRNHITPSPPYLALPDGGICRQLNPCSVLDNALVSDKISSVVTVGNGAMAARLTLDQVIGVRVPVPQPT